MVPYLSVAQVSLQWQARYAGSGAGQDFATALVVGAAGNVYVTGRSIGTYADYATIKYNAAGVQQWVALYDGPGHGTDQANDIAVDASGNVYVTGLSLGDGTGTNYATIKYNANGNQLWVSRYNGLNNEGDGASSIALDAAGNVYVTGGSDIQAPLGDIATIKYNPDGDVLWEKRYGRAAGNQESGADLAVDASGNVYVTGYAAEDSDPLFNDYVTLKYNADGELQWDKIYDGPRGEDDHPRDLALDPEGNIYVTGESFGLTSNNDYATIKYNPDGEELWVARYNSAGSNRDEPFELVLDAQGNVYVTGESESTVPAQNETPDYATIKYNNEGVEQWVRRYNGSANNSDVATSIALDTWGNIYVPVAALAAAQARILPLLSTILPASSNGWSALPRRALIPSPPSPLLSAHRARPYMWPAGPMKMATPMTCSPSNTPTRPS